MDSEVIKTFNKSLISMQDCKGVVSKQKVVEITKAAMNAVRYFKHVVFIIERYLAKCRQQFKIPALYVMDSLLRQAKKQYRHKDVFAPRFAVNLTNTISNVLDCESGDRLKVVRVINLWQAHQIFNEDVIDPLLRHCKANGLETDPARVEHMVKGDKADMQLYQPQEWQHGSAEKSLISVPGSTVKTIPTTPTGPPPPPIVGFHGNNAREQAAAAAHQQSLDERLSQFSRQKLGLHRSNSNTTTPRTIESGPKTPPLEDQDHRISTGQLAPGASESGHSLGTLGSSGGGFNGPETVQLLAGTGVQPASLDAVQRLRQFINDRCQEQLEIERRRQGNIKNLLSRDFDYSDEEDEGAGGGGGGHQNHNNGGAMASASSPGGGSLLTSVSKEKLANIARSLLNDPTVLQEIHKLASSTASTPLQSPVKMPSISQQQHGQQQQQFTMPDFSVPPPNMANGGPQAGLFMPFLVPTSMGNAAASAAAAMLQAQQQQAAATFGTAQHPPNSLFNAAANMQPTIQLKQEATDQQHREHHHRDQRDHRDRGGGGDREHEHQHRRDSRSGGGGDRTSGGRKRTREWSPADERGGGGLSTRRDSEQQLQKTSSSSSSRRNSRREERKRSRSGSPRHRDREQREKERAAEKEKEREREELARERRRIGLPTKPKADHVLIGSRTLWFGRLPPMTSEQDIVEAVKDAGTPEKVTVVGSRGCAYVTMPDRKSAYKIIDRMANGLQVAKKSVKLDWATITGIKEDQRLVEDYWDSKRGIAEIPFGKLPDGMVDSLLEGAWLDLDTLPAQLRDRYTNTGLKQQQQQQQAQLPSTIQLPPGIALPAGMPPGTAMPQMMAFNPMMLSAMSTMFPPMGMMASLPTSMPPPPGVAITSSVPPQFATGANALQMSMLGQVLGQTPKTSEGGAAGFANLAFAQAGGGFAGGRGAAGFGRGGTPGGFRGGRGRGRGGFEGRTDFNSPQGVGGYRGRGGGVPGGYRGGGGGFRGAGGGEPFGRGRGRGGAGFTRFGTPFGAGPPHLQLQQIQQQQQSSELEGNDVVKKEEEQGGGQNGGFSNASFGGGGGFGAASGGDGGPPGMDAADLKPPIAAIPHQNPSETESGDAPPGLD